MKILYIDYTLKYKSLDIYTAGCIGNPHCVGCHNPETWSFDQGDKYDENFFIKLKLYLKDFNSMIDNIMIFGGEPLDNKFIDVISLLKDINTFDKKIWLFTRFEINDIPIEIQKLCDYIKTGRYDTKSGTNNIEYFGMKLSTSNQKIIKCR